MIGAHLWIALNGKTRLLGTTRQLADIPLEGAKLSALGIARLAQGDQPTQRRGICAVHERLQERVEAVEHLVQIRLIRRALAGCA